LASYPGTQDEQRELVDQAILDMQSVMDPLNAAIAEMLAAAETAETTDDAAVTAKHGKTKADREAKEKSGKPEGAGKPADKGGRQGEGSARLRRLIHRSDSQPAGVRPRGLALCSAA